jgi:hypothetical protein
MSIPKVTVREQMRQKIETKKVQKSGLVNQKIKAAKLMDHA